MNNDCAFRTGYCIYVCEESWTYKFQDWNDLLIFVWCLWEFPIAWLGTLKTLCNLLLLLLAMHVYPSLLNCMQFSGGSLNSLKCQQTFENIPLELWLKVCKNIKVKLASNITLIFIASKNKVLTSRFYQNYRSFNCIKPPVILYVKKIMSGRTRLNKFLFVFLLFKKCDSQIVLLLGHLKKHFVIFAN